MLQSLYRSMVIMAAPLILASLGGLITYHAGIINVAMEGLILAGAFAAVTFFLHVFKRVYWCGRSDNCRHFIFTIVFAVCYDLEIR